MTSSVDQFADAMDRLTGTETTKEEKQDAQSRPEEKVEEPGERK